MVIYKYIQNLFKPDLQEEKFCEKHKIVYIKPTDERKKWLEKWIKTAKLPTVETSQDIICYWRYFGTWGMYHPEDKSISICPINIEKAPGGLAGVIRHEILHLHHPEADKMLHGEKEKYIDHFQTED